MILRVELQVVHMQYSAGSRAILPSSIQTSCFPKTLDLHLLTYHDGSQPQHRCHAPELLASNRLQDKLLTDLDRSLWPPAIRTSTFHSQMNSKKCSPQSATNSFPDPLARHPPAARLEPRRPVAHPQADPSTPRIPPHPPNASGGVAPAPECQHAQHDKR